MISGFKTGKTMKNVGFFPFLAASLAVGDDLLKLRMLRDPHLSYLRKVLRITPESFTVQPGDLWKQVMCNPVHVGWGGH